MIKMLRCLRPFTFTAWPGSTPRARLPNAAYSQPKCLTICRRQCVSVREYRTRSEEETIELGRKFPLSSRDLV